MRLTRHTDNALRALIYVAIHTDEAPARITDIARRMGMSEDHLAKVVARLAQLRYVETIRGRVGGVRLAREGLVSAISPGKKLSWGKAAEKYREYLFGVGREVKGGKTPDGDVKSKGGFTQREMEAVLAAGGRLTLAQALRCRVRYFTDGVVLGSQGFVDEFFASRREAFGEKRQSGGRRMKGADWGGLRVLRDLKDRVVTVPGVA